LAADVFHAIFNAITNLLSIVPPPQFLFLSVPCAGSTRCSYGNQVASLKGLMLLQLTNAPIGEIAKIDENCTNLTPVERFF
jgi:hypothetical protein